MKVIIDGVQYVPAPPAPASASAGKGLMAALEVRFDSDAGDDRTVRQYLQALLSTLWSEEESFDSKRPFGNSGWVHDLFDALAKAGFIDLGPLDGDGRPYQWTGEQMRMADAYVHDLILAAFYGAPSPEGETK
jgi:hypothetical protein